jgi:hypothetical protein
MPTWREWVKKNFGAAHIFTNADANFRPGIILGAANLNIKDACWQALGQSEDNPPWVPKRTPAQIIEGNFQHDRSLEGTLKIPGFVTVGGSTSSKIVAHFSVSGGESAFLPGLLGDMAFREILKAAPKERKKKLRGLLVVERVFFCKEMKLTFQREGAVAAKVDVEASIKPAIGVSASWKDNVELTLTSDATIPFAGEAFKF